MFIDEQWLEPSRMRSPYPLNPGWHTFLIESNGAGSGINIGSTIVVRNLKTDREQRFTIVHPREVNPTAGRISVESPVGKAVLGRAEGDEVEVQAPAGTMRLKIQSVDS